MSADWEGFAEGARLWRARAEKAEAQVAALTPCCCDHAQFLHRKNNDWSICDADDGQCGCLAFTIPRHAPWR